MKVLYDGSPKAVKERLMLKICIITRKTNCPHFFDLSIKRIGRQALSNRIGSILKCIDYDGHNLNLRNETISKLAM